MTEFIRKFAVLNSLNDWRYGSAPNFDRMTEPELLEAKITYEVLGKVIEGIERMDTISIRQDMLNHPEDIELVVRCKECVENDAQNWCWKFGYTMHDDGYCSFGERKTDG